MATTNVSPKQRDELLNTAVGQIESILDSRIPLTKEVEEAADSCQTIAVFDQLQGTGQGEVDMMRGSPIPTSQSGPEEVFLMHDGVISGREKESQDVMRGLQMLCLDLPPAIVGEVAASYSGMAPMERFLVETCKFQGKFPDIEGRKTSSSCGATMGSLGDGGSFNSRGIHASKASDLSI